MPMSDERIDEILRELQTMRADILKAAAEHVAAATDAAERRINELMNERIESIDLTVQMHDAVKDMRQVLDVNITGMAANAAANVESINAILRGFEARLRLVEQSSGLSPVVGNLATALARISAHIDV